RQLYGYVHPDRPLEIVAALVEATERPGSRTDFKTSLPISETPKRILTAGLYFRGASHQASIIPREAIPSGAKIIGPAIVVEPLPIPFLDPTGQPTMLPGGKLLLEPIESSSAHPLNHSPALHSAADPVLLEVFNNHFTAIATQMGITLRNTSMSVNV